MYSSIISCHLKPKKLIKRNQVFCVLGTESLSINELQNLV
jgi:hypothetical protein